MRAVVLGGYGNFGARICKALAGDAAIELIVAGRDAARASELAAQLGARSCGVAIDVASTGLADALRSSGAQLVVHTAGPFQGQDYRVARAAAAAGAHYIDLADGRRFVCDFRGALDGAFRVAGRSAVSGASTVPALSSAVVDALLPRFGRLDAIDTCIAPAQQAPRGRATLEAVLGYCGEPVRVWRNGAWHESTGWASPVDVRFARMPPRLASLCDIPDLELFPTRYPGVRTVLFRAALEVTATQRALALLAALRRRRLAPPVPRFARLLQRAAPWFDRFGSAYGGMVVCMRGRDRRDNPLAVEWHITADSNHGPEIPCMATVLLARKIARGQKLPIGAQACVGLLKLDEFEPEFARWSMNIDLVESGREQMAHDGYSYERSGR